MCMLTYFPEDAQPDAEALRNGALLNSDGHGYAIVAGNRLIIRKSMRADELIEQFVHDRAAHRRGPALFHSRISTAGVIDKANCHPFRFGGDRRTVVAHNGVLPKMAQPHKKDWRSDTRIAAEAILPFKFGHLGLASNRKALETWVGKYNKLVILTVNPIYAQRSYIINESAGTWDHGIWYSNHDYKGWVSNSWRDWQRADLWPEECAFCGEFGQIDEISNVCKNCHTCADCYEYVSDCECYLPESQRGKHHRDDERMDDAAYDAWWADVRARLANRDRDKVYVLGRDREADAQTAER